MELVDDLRRWINGVLLKIKVEVGQTTAEYALVLIAAAAVAVVLIKWATDNEDLKGFFTNVIANLTEKANEG